jgi:hypothetical protein
VEKWAALWDISPKRFWKQFGVNTCMLDEKTGETIYYPCDVEGTLRELLDPRFKRVWD